MPPLRDRQCRPIAAGEKALGQADIDAYLQELPGWSVDQGKLSKTFRFKDYYQTTAFANAIFWVSHQQDHHPDIELSYNRLTIRYDTHSIGGLSENDFICASRVEALSSLG